MIRTRVYLSYSCLTCTCITHNILPTLKYYDKKLKNNNNYSNGLKKHN